MPKDLKPAIPGQRYARPQRPSATNYNALLSEVERQGRMSAQYPLELSNNSGGVGLRFVEPCFWAKITSVDSSTFPRKYAWVEVQPSGSGFWATPDDARSGTFSNNPAYEVSQQLAPAQAIVWLMPSFTDGTAGATYLFTHCCPLNQSEGTNPCCVGFNLPYNLCFEITAIDSGSCNSIVGYEVQLTWNVATNQWENLAITDMPAGCTGGANMTFGCNSDGKWVLDWTAATGYAMYFDVDWTQGDSGTSVNTFQCNPFNLCVSGVPWTGNDSCGCTDGATISFCLNAGICTGSGSSSSPPPMSRGFMPDPVPAAFREDRKRRKINSQWWVSGDEIRKALPKRVKKRKGCGCSKNANTTNTNQTPT